jgi:hypothetical protein
MPLSDILATGLEAGLPIAGAYFGPLGVGAGGIAGQALGSGIRSAFRTPTVQEQARDQLIGRLQQPNQLPGFGGIQQTAMNDFYNRIVPELQGRYGGRQGAFSSALGQAGSDLASRLAGLRTNYELQGAGLGQQREGMLGSLLTGQQNLAQNQNQFNQSAMLSMLGQLLGGSQHQDLMTQFGLNSAGQAASGAEGRQAQATNQQLGAANQAAGYPQNFDTVYNQGGPGLLAPLLQGALSGLGGLTSLIR